MKSNNENNQYLTFILPQAVRCQWHWMYQSSFNSSAGEE